MTYVLPSFRVFESAEEVQMGAGSTKHPHGLCMETVYNCKPTWNVL